MINPGICSITFRQKTPEEVIALEDGSNLWKPCLAAAAELGADRFALLEFVRDDDPELFEKDAACLKKYIAGNE